MDSRSEDRESGIGNRESGVVEGVGRWGDGEMGRSYRVLRSRSRSGGSRPQA
ncbi:MAG: hypothetical protein F6K26_15485 [Moorea sp. SIO2I5]|nr:hypothetical protein [Moorena sp. SIO2I5]